MTSISHYPRASAQSTRELPRYSIFAADCPAEARRAILLRLLVMAASSTVTMAGMAMVVAHFSRG